MPGFEPSAALAETDPDAAAAAFARLATDLLRRAGHLIHAADAAGSDDGLDALARAGHRRRAPRPLRLTPRPHFRVLATLVPLDGGSGLPESRASPGGTVVRGLLRCLEVQDWEVLAYQQGILAVQTTPNQGSWPAISALFEDIPDGSPVYGYMSDTGDEEAIVIATLAATELALVPTKQAPNLSFHVAVGADSSRVRLPEPDVTDVAPCDGTTLDVVLGMTDGDNLQVPLSFSMRPDVWDSPRRGELAFGWSLGPGLAVLAPAVWDIYAREATDRDELATVAGWGYTAPGLLSDPGAFYDLSFRAMDDLGMTTFWSLGGGIETPWAPYWGPLEGAAGAGIPNSVLIGYGNGTGSAFHSPGGRAAFTSRSVYHQTPTHLAQHVEALLATPVEDRPVVSFLSVTNWRSTVDDLVTRLAPFEEQGVRFLTPAEAAACMPPAEPPEDDPVEPGDCLVEEGTITEHGLSLISAPAAADAAYRTTRFEVPVTVAAPATLEAGGTGEITATFEVDLASFASTVLEERVRPTVEVGYGAALARSAWVEVRFADLVARLDVSDDLAPSGAPVVTSTGATPAATLTGTALELAFPAMAEDSRAPGAPFEVTVTWTVVAGDDATGGATVTPGALTFDLTLDIGVMLSGVPLTGGIDASLRCDPASDPLATVTIVAPPDAPDHDRCRRRDHGHRPHPPGRHGGHAGRGHGHGPGHGPGHGHGHGHGPGHSHQHHPPGRSGRAR